jgi:hypothetical protein
MCRGPELYGHSPVQYQVSSREDDPMRALTKLLVKAKTVG